LRCVRCCDPFRNAGRLPDSGAQYTVFVVGRSHNDFEYFDWLADQEPLADPIDNALATLVFEDTQNRHQTLIQESGILRNIITNMEDLPPIHRLCVYRAAARISGKLIQAGGIKIIGSPFFVASGEHIPLADTSWQPARQDTIPVYADRGDGIRPVGTFEAEDAYLVASMVAELAMLQEFHKVPPLIEDLTEIDLRG
jgi:hypothetical protein